MKRVWGLILALIVFYPMAEGRAYPVHAGYSSQSEGLEWPKLKRGAKSSKVKALQLLLNAQGAKLTVDSRFGASTEKAVKRFQGSQRIQKDGVVGAQTWEKLVVPLRRGMHGPFVRALQGLLTQNGYRVKQDSVFGRATEKAVIKYQSDNGGETLARDGEVGDLEWCSLLGGYIGTEA